MAKNEAKIKFTAETGEFNKAIQKSNSEMTELRAEMRLNETQMKATGETVEGLENKHQILEKQLKASHDKTEALNQKVQKAVEIFGENSTEAAKLRTQLLNAQTAEEKLRQAVEQCAAKLSDFKGDSQDARTASEKLNDTIEEQQAELKKLKDAYADAVLQYGKGSDEAKDLAKQIDKLSGELKDNQTALGKAQSAADKLDKSFDNAGDAARDSADGFTVAKGALADLVSEAVQFGIEKISEFIGYLKELPEATRELRQDLATLETSFEKQSFTTEQATQTWKDLYTVFGEDDRAVEAANLIAKMSDNQQDLNDWVTITTGIFGTYQDSLPVEGLAEAAMETAKTGDVTGVLADALNWSSEAATMFSKYMGEDVTTAEEAFNVALSECTTEQERQALITETLTALYGDAATKFEEASGSQLAAKEAAAELALAEAELAEAIEPCTTAWDEMKAELITAVTPAIEGVCGVLQDALGWLKDHPGACKVLAAVLGTLAIAFSGLAVALGIYTVAQWAANSAILAGFIPILVAALPIIAAVVAAVALVAAVVVYWDELKAAAVKCWDAIKEAWNKAGEWFSTNVIQPIVKFFKGLWQDIQNIWDSISESCQKAWDFICNVVQVGIMLIGSVLSAAFQIITLPFRFIWENCKEYVFAAWEWIKSKVSAAASAVSSTISKVFSKVRTFFANIWNSCKSVVSSAWSAIRNAVANATNAVFSKVSQIWNKVKSATSTAFNACKSVASSVWNSLKSVVTNAVNGVKSKVSSIWNSIKSTTSSVFQSCFSVVSDKFGKIKSKITSTIEGARDAVKKAIDKIKGFFNFKWSLPKIKLPHFKISGKFSLNPPSVPKFSVQWYKLGAIFRKPTLFNTPYGIKGVGEAGAEAVLPINKLEGYIANAIEKTQNIVNLEVLAEAIEDLANRPVSLNINGRQFALATAGDGDSVNGLRSTFKSRGLVLD